MLSCRVALVLKFNDWLLHSLLGGQRQGSLRGQLTCGLGVFIGLERGLHGGLVGNFFRFNIGPFFLVRRSDLERDFRWRGLLLCWLLGEVTRKEKGDQEDQRCVDEARKQKEKREAILLPPGSRSLGGLEGTHAKTCSRAFLRTGDGGLTLFLRSGFFGINNLPVRA